MRSVVLGLIGALAGLAAATGSDKPEKPTYTKCKCVAQPPSEKGTKDAG
jgi:hypothetical protein